MFAATASLLKKRSIPAYGMFMKKMKNHPDLQGLAVPARGRKTAKMYRKLSAAEKAKLAAAGKR